MYLWVLGVVNLLKFLLFFEKLEKHFVTLQTVKILTLTAAERKTLSLHNVERKTLR
jgi:hypothetical protein